MGWWMCRKNGGIIGCNRDIRRDIMERYTSNNRFFKLWLLSCWGDRIEIWWDYRNVYIYIHIYIRMIYGYTPKIVCLYNIYTLYIQCSKPRMGSSFSRLCEFLCAVSGFHLKYSNHGWWSSGSMISRCIYVMWIFIERDRSIDRSIDL